MADLIGSADSEGLFQTLIATAVDGIVVIDERAQILVFNQACEHLFGYSPDEVLGKNVSLLMPEPYHGEHDGYLARYIETGVRHIIGIGREVIGKKKSGSTFPIHLSVGEGRFGAGRIFVGILRDITERQQSDRRLRELQSDLFYHDAIVTNSDDAIIGKDLNGIVRSWNKGAETLFGWLASEMIGQPILLLFPPDRLHEEDEFLARLRAGGRIDHYETVRRRKDGHEIEVSVTISSIRGPDGEIIGASKIARDITAERRAARNLRESQRTSEEALALLDTLLSSAPIGVAFIDLSYHFVRINEAMAGFNGLPVEDHVGRTVRDVVPGMWAQIEPAFRDVLATGRPLVNIEIHGGTASRWDQDRHWLVSFYPVRAGGAIMGLGVVALEVTEQRRVEAQLRQAQKMEAIGSLTGGMAHDFNNLLGVIIGNLDMLVGRVGNDSVAEDLTVEALDAALRGADLTQRLLAFSRRQPLRATQIDINELVSAALKLLSRVLGETIEVVFVPGDNIHVVAADRAQLEAALTNMTANARDAMPRGGRLMISTANRYLDEDYAAQHPEVIPGEYALIEISDTGTGIAPDIIGRVFEPFFTTKELGKGSGLGLSMVFGFVKQSGGHVSVYSEPGAGTTFRLYLPRATVEIRQDEPAQKTEPVRGYHETVLVVEDNAAMRKVVVRQLTELDYRVFEAENAAAALELLQREHVDVLFTDIVMPGGMNGIDLARSCSERWPVLRILLTSGFPEAKLNGDRRYAAEWPILSKPYRTEDLARMLRKILDK
ncbi:MAG TPA: PAS domain S-box protein [Rhizomicrobium sp.]